MKGQTLEEPPVMSQEMVAQPGEPFIEIRPTSKWIAVNWEEFWHYRELFYFLAWRDIKVRYKNTALGAAWAVLQPLLNMVVFSVFFGKLAKIPSNGFPYPIFAFCGLLPWQLFSFSLTEASNSMITNQQLITKVYFPRIIIPTSSMIVGLLDFAISFVVLLVLMVYFHIFPSVRLLTLPAFLLLALAAAMAVGLWLAALNVKYRDVRYTLPFITQLWMLATPIAYPSSLLSVKWQWVYGLNPMAGVVEGFRWAILGQPLKAPGMIGISAASTMVLLISSLFFFRQTEKTFADII